MLAKEKRKLEEQKSAAEKDDEMEVAKDKRERDEEDSVERDVKTKRVQKNGDKRRIDEEHEDHADHVDLGQMLEDDGDVEVFGLPVNEQANEVYDGKEDGEIE